VVPNIPGLTTWSVTRAHGVETVSIRVNCPRKYRKKPIDLIRLVERELRSALSESGERVPDFLVGVDMLI
jgi:hypothetical protein